MSEVNSREARAHRRILDAHALGEPDAYPLVPLLPPVDRRTAREEELFRTLHWKDIAATQYPTTNVPMPSGPISAVPWIPNEAEPDSGAAHVVSDPYVDEFFAVTLSRDGASDASQVADGRGPRLVAEEAEGSAANETIQSEENDDEGDNSDENEEIGVSTERRRELNQQEERYGDGSGRSRGDAAGRSARQSARHFEGKHETEGRVLREQRTYHDITEIDTEHVEGEIRYFERGAGYNGSFNSSREEISASGGGAAGGSFMRAEAQTTSDGRFSASAEGRAVSLEVEAGGSGEVRFAEREATLGYHVGGEAALLNGDADAEMRVYPRRDWNAYVVTGVNNAASWLRLGKLLEEVDETDDWTIVLHGGVTGTVGYAASLSGDAYRTRRGFGAGGGIRLAPGLGGGFRGGFRVERPE